MHWHVEAIDPAALDDAFLTAHHRLAAAAMAADRPYEPPLTRRGADEWLRAASSTARRFLLWGVRDDSELVGAVRLSLPGYENSDHAQIELRVDPARWRQGAGTALLRVALAAASAEERQTVSAWLTKDTPAAALATRLGMRVTSTMLIQRLDWATADRSRWQQPTPPGYHAAQWISPAPQALIANFAEAKTAMHGVPFGGVSYRLPEWTVERVRAAEAELTARGIKQWVVVAVHQPTGEIAGLTELQFRDERPGIGLQMDTSVRPNHRGHRLGLFVKSQMLHWLDSGDISSLDGIQTSVAPHNPHMLRINEALGFTVARTAQLMEGDVQQLMSQLAVGVSPNGSK